MKIINRMNTFSILIPDATMVMTVDDKIRHEQNENDEFGERGAQKAQSHDWNMLSPLDGQCREENNSEILANTASEPSSAGSYSISPGVHFITF